MLLTGSNLAARQSFRSRLGPRLYFYRGRLQGSLRVLENAEDVMQFPWLQDVDAAVRLAPDDPWILCWRAIEFSGRRRDQSQIIADLEKAISLEPEWMEAQEFLVREHELIKRFAKMPAE